MNPYIKALTVGLALASLTACASPSDKLYREAMAKYYQTINTGRPLVPAHEVTGAKPYQNTRPKTYGLYDRHWHLQGYIKDRAY